MITTRLDRIVRTVFLCGASISMIALVVGFAAKAIVSPLAPGFVDLVVGVWALGACLMVGGLLVTLGQIFKS